MIQLSNEAYQHQHQQGQQHQHQHQHQHQQHQQQQLYSGGRPSYYNDQVDQDEAEVGVSGNNNFCSPLVSPAPQYQQHLSRGGGEQIGGRHQSRILDDQSGRCSRLLEEQPGWPGGQLQLQQQQHFQQQHQEQHQQHFFVRGFSSQIAPPRPKNRNSNMLSAILCLIKEIDGPSLEVVELAARCRMEELED